MKKTVSITIDVDRDDIPSLQYTICDVLLEIKDDISDGITEANNKSDKSRSYKFEIKNR